jgi:60 kDa SS-A/Ro ribonucleoprotein
MSIYTKYFSTRETSQSQPIPGSGQVPNSGGGYSFAVDKWARLNRFLVLGAEGGSYYATERELVIENATAVLECLDADAPRTVRTIVEISDAGRAPKNDPAIFALAIAAGAGHAALAIDALPKVCRIGTHLFQFAEAVQAFRGWGKTLKRGVAGWYTSMAPERLGYQVAKYQQRNGWSHRDLLRLAHPATDDAAMQAVLRWVIGGKDSLGARTVKKGDRSATYPDVAAALPAFLGAVDEAKSADTARLCTLIHEYDLPREVLPTEKLNEVAVWEALLEKMPLTALVRNLGKMTAIGLLTPMSKAVGAVCDKLGDGEYLRKSRAHPLAILIAARTYAQGHGDKGRLRWEPVQQVNEVLDAAFYRAFGNVEPAGKRTLLAIDVSGSMDGGGIAGSSLTPREGAGALAMVTATTEPAYHAVGFSAPGHGVYGGQWGGGDPGMQPINLGKCRRLTDVVAEMRAIPMGGTDCALPMLHALKQRWEVDTFVVLTDSETWAGSIHPSQAIRTYREKTGTPAKLVVVGMVANGFTIADPSDAGMLDVVGFDTAVPNVINDFSRGNI